MRPFPPPKKFRALAPDAVALLQRPECRQCHHFRRFFVFVILVFMFICLFILGSVAYTAYTQMLPFETRALTFRGLSVCLSVCLSACWSRRAPGKRLNRDSVWRQTRVGQGTCYRGCKFTSPGEYDGSISVLELRCALSLALLYSIGPIATCCHY